MQKDDNSNKQDGSSSPVDNSGSQAGDVPEVNDTGDEEGQFSDPIASPSVLGEEGPSGDSPTGEPQDIDKALADLGLENDDNGAKPLSTDNIDY